MRLIGITGLKYSGKTTLANLIQKATKAKTQQIAFADSLKEEVAKVCGVTVEFIEINKAVFRPILKWWGTDFKRRLYRDDYWIIQARTKIILHFDDGTGAVIVPDVRFLNEATYIKSIPGSTLVRIVRDNGNQPKDLHPSEQEQSQIQVDKTIENNGTINDLYHQARNLIRDINSQTTPKHHL